MRVVLHRVKSASCEVNGQIVGQIQHGLLLFVGFKLEDSAINCESMVNKMIHARVFEDEAGKLNLDVQTIQGSILSISQFTLYGDTKKGHRPSFDQAARPESAKALYEHFNTLLSQHVPVQCGQFQAHMNITSINDGPVTLMYEN